MDIKRRDFFRKGTAVATAGLVGTAFAAESSSAVAATARTTPTIFDFGAVGDGITDDSAAFIRALDVAATEGRMIIVPGFTYAIKQPIKWVSKANAVKQWGLESQGAVLKSSITGGQDVLSFTSNHLVRYLQITGNLTIKCSGTDRHGFRLSCPWPGGKYIYNVGIDRLAVEGAGGDCLMIDGNVFESHISNSFFQDAKGNGATFAHSKGGVVTAINVSNCYFNKNGKHGLEATTLDAAYGGAADIRVIGGYCRENKLYGFRYNNGTAPGAAIYQVGFENNYTSLAPGNDGGAHIFGQVRMTVRDCNGYNEFGGATYLLRGWFNEIVTLDGCFQAAGGAMKATGKSRLVQVSGPATGHFALRSSAGGVAIASGNKATWQAANCTGPSPIGDLKANATVAGV